MPVHDEQHESRGKISVKPGKPVSAGALILLTFMLVFGIIFFVSVGMEIMAYDEPALKYSLLAFALVWCGAVLFLIVYHLLNLKRAKGVSVIDVDIESSDVKGSDRQDPMERLRELEALRKDNLISAQEYEIKRQEILSEKW